MTESKEYAYRVRCRLDEIEREKTVYARITMVDGKEFPIACNGCDDLQGVKACDDCRRDVMASILDGTALRVEDY